jgi:uncharacterized membrane protein
MNKIYKIESIYNGLEGFREEPVRIFKGKTEISIDLSNITEVVKLIIDFDDGTSLITKEIDFKDPLKLTQEIIKKTYFPSPNVDYVFFYPTVYITYSNFKQLIYQIPIKISRDSFFSSYKNLEISSCQFIDDEDNSLFVNFSTANGEILRLKIK